MRIRYIQILKGCIALIVTLAGLYTGQAAWQKYAVDLPLDKALHEINGVEEAFWNKGNNKNDVMSIYVKLGSTANFQKTYEEINKTIKETIKNRQYNLEIKDNRSPELDQIYYGLHCHIQKAIADGDFPLLEEKVREKASAAGVVSKLYVDEQNIYLQLSKNNSSLYNVAVRHFDRSGVNF